MLFAADGAERSLRWHAGATEGAEPRYWRRRSGLSGWGSRSDHCGRWRARGVLPGLLTGRSIRDDIGQVSAKRDGAIDGRRLTLAPRSFAPVRVAWEKLQRVRSAPFRSAPCKFARKKFASLSVAFFKISAREIPVSEIPLAQRIGG